MQQVKLVGDGRKQMSTIKCFKEQNESGCSSASGAAPNAQPAAPRCCFGKVSLVRHKRKARTVQDIGQPFTVFLKTVNNI